jgi:tetratricopeptide (TPR) repeat protein
MECMICLSWRKKIEKMIKKFVLKPLLSGLMLLLSALPMMAQNVDAGIKSLESGDYKAAMAEFDKALAEPGKLKEKALARVYYYRCIARITYVHKAKNNLEGMQMQQIRDLSVGAHEDMVAAKKNDIDGKMAADIQSGTKRLQDLLLELGRDANAIAQDPNRKEADKKDAYEDMVRYGGPIVANDKFQYMGYVFLGNGHLGKGDTTTALKNYHLADDWFFRSAPKDGDMNIAYSYIQIARLEWATHKNFDNAMKFLDKGRAQLDGESKKIQTLGNRPPAEKAALSRMAHDIGLDLDRAASELRLAAGK